MAIIVFSPPFPQPFSAQYFPPRYPSQNRFPHLICHHASSQSRRKFEIWWITAGIGDPSPDQKQTPFSTRCETREISYFPLGFRATFPSFMLIVWWPLSLIRLFEAEEAFNCDHCTGWSVFFSEILFSCCSSVTLLVMSVFKAIKSRYAKYQPSPSPSQLPSRRSWNLTVFPPISFPFSPRKSVIHSGFFSYTNIIHFHLF